ncbi:hypothetical protein [Chondrinema litorale]|uniref:hypothetical protein n=1 Tax=Chondrinema litorale TaxID=2994555 RepID=UPI00254374F3|nr:hypothetical protein [Chondrinema litorale]UZR98854.1 hypothetical protein OQ292_33215 [Chondrinema litorale]
MIFPTGISAKLKDKRVDKILIKHGYQPNSCQIFYSPIKYWRFTVILALITVIPFIGLGLKYFYLIIDFKYFILGYLFISFLIWRRMNNTIVLTEGQLLIINPNPPFRKFIKYDLAKINKVKLAGSKLKFILWLFLSSGNYIEITSNNKNHRYFCIALKLDTYDENFTKKTLDDLHHTLRNKNLPVEFMFD